MLDSRRIYHEFDFSSIIQVKSLFTFNINFAFQLEHYIANVEFIYDSDICGKNSIISKIVSDYY